MRPVKARNAIFLPLAALLLAACGGASATTSSSTTTPQAAQAQEPPLGPNQLRRSDLMKTLSAGPGVFLGELDVEAVLKNGRFHGWRIVSFREPASWEKVDLKPGDVVLRVNGYPLERPEEAMVPWQSLAIAEELHVDYEREGEARELRYEILDDPNAPKPR